MPQEIRISERFRIVRLLGYGGMGVVYEAVDREREARVALKTLRSMSVGALLRFKHEFRSLVDLSHPNLVRLGELLEHEGQFYFTMELVDGVPFVDHVRDAPTTEMERATPPPGPRRVPTPARARDASTAVSVRGSTSPPPPRQPAPGQLDETRLRAALRQLALGLSALHAAGQVHRDIKPSNVLVTREGRVVILDFGLVAPEASDEEDAIVGTADYMAPEQAAGRPVDARADAYSLGVMLYLALVGSLPFVASADAVVHMKQRAAPIAPSAVVPGVPPDLEQLCIDLLQPDPERRPTDAELLARLAVPHVPSVPAGASTFRFFGRGRELAALEEALAEVRAGSSRAVVIEGESGLGKTALMRRFLDGLDPAVLALAGRCYDRESVPYKAMDGVIDDLARRLGPLLAEERATLRVDDMSLAATVFPVLSLLVPAAPGLAGDPASTDHRARLFAAVRALFRRIGEACDLVVAIDDLQWADADSLALLSELLRPPDGPRLLLLCTSRIPMETRRVALPAARIVTLDRLSPQAAHDLAVSVATSIGAPIPPPEMDELLREARGHPLFLDALVRHHVLAREAGGPARLDDALRARIDRLPGRARRLLEAVVVAGEPLSRQLANEVLATGTDELDPLIAVLRGANLVRAASAGGERIEPYHDRVRDTLLARMTPAQREAWRGRFAQARQPRPAEPRPDLLAPDDTEPPGML